ncbi:MAG: hypothetical protein R2794_13485 [Chitinophagales bacterium]
MPATTFYLLKDIFLLFAFVLCALWMWGVIRFQKERQEKLEHLFRNSRPRFKWMFLLGALALAGLYVYRYFIE